MIFLGLLSFQDFLRFQLILRLPYSKHFHSTLNYASTANIQEVMKFYNLIYKTFETELYKGDIISFQTSRLQLVALYKI